VSDFDGWPVLTNAVMIAAFEGWNDAGDAATSAVEHLERIWDARTLIEVDPDPYYDFQVNRPNVTVSDRGQRKVTWPTTRISTCRPPGAAFDVVLVRGIEPNMRWRSFCDEVLDAVHGLDVTMMITMGALLSDSPHTRPTPVSGSTYDDESALKFGLERSRYEGPTGIVGILQDACAAIGVPAVSFWAAVPHYVAQPPNPKATLALLHRIEETLDLAVDAGELPEEATEWQKLVDEMAAEDEEVTDYIRNLEQRDEEGELKEASGDSIAKEFERYLRRRDEPPQGFGPGPSPRG
jgi:proteasome assembly chaperone (PAC2) family protein